MSITSFIRSVLASGRIAWAFSRAWTGIAARASTYPLTPSREPKEGPVLDAAYKDVWSMPTLPVSNASPRRCPATHSLSTPWGTTRTLGCTNREGHAGPHVVARGNARPSERFTEYSVVHGVAWFNYTEHRSREVWTRCGRYFITSNRTRNNRAITCMRCMCR